MVTLNRIYTRTGDKGQTSLGNGQRVAKYAPRVHAYGTVDELNAHLGHASLVSSGMFDEKIGWIQNDLFDLGADLCRPDMHEDAKADYTVLRMVDAQVERLESEIDMMNEGLQPLKSFVLPGGSELAVHFHLCRTVCRRAERLTVELSQLENVNEIAVRYLNRLSDWFFVASRVANSGGADDVLWVPGANR